MYNILICDDDRDIVSALDIYLTSEGYQTIKAYNGREALRAAEGHEIHLILMDIMMPELDGIRATAKLREGSNVPIILLTAKSEDTDKILGLNIGADDYITKPFNPLELVARVKTQLRRYTRYNRPLPAEEGFDFRGLQISRTTHKCLLYGEELALTPLEFSILWYLCERRGQVVSSEELFEAVWGAKYLDGSNTVMSHIARLREKMHEPSRRPKFVKTVWGVGYTIE
jgi:two-component system response regulator VanR